MVVLLQAHAATDLVLAQMMGLMELVAVDIAVAGDGLDFVRYSHLVGARFGSIGRSREYCVKCMLL